MLHRVALVKTDVSEEHNIPEDGFLHSHCRNNLKSYKKQTPCLLVRKRAIPTDRPPLLGKVSANFYGYMNVARSAQQVPTAVNLDFLDRRSYLSFT
jgi:hypothetical protein